MLTRIGSNSELWYHIHYFYWMLESRLLLTCFQDRPDTFPHLGAETIHLWGHNMTQPLHKNRSDEGASEKIQRSSVLWEAASPYEWGKNKMHQGNCGHSSNENVRENYFLSATTPFLFLLCWWEKKGQHRVKLVYLSNHCSFFILGALQSSVFAHCQGASNKTFTYLQKQW